MMLTLLVAGLVIGCSSSHSTLLNHENIDLRYIDPISESEGQKLSEFMFEYLGGAGSGGADVHLSLGENQETYEVRLEAREGLQLDVLRPWSVAMACALEENVFVGKNVDIIFIESGETYEQKMDVWALNWLGSKIVVREICRPV